MRLGDFVPHLAAAEVSPGNIVEPNQAAHRSIVFPIGLSTFVGMIAIDKDEIVRCPGAGPMNGSFVAAVGDKYRNVKAFRLEIVMGLAQAVFAGLRPVRAWQLNRSDNRTRPTGGRHG